VLTAIGLAAGPESDKAGPLGLLTIVALGVAVYFLYRSMVRHVKKVPASFDRPSAAAEEPGEGGPGAAAPGETAPGEGGSGAAAPGETAPGQPGRAERSPESPAQ
jgi:hypothetical protein